MIAPPTTGPAAVAMPTAVPISAERPAPLAAREQLLHQAGHLRVDQPAGQALQHPAGDEHARVRARARPAR